MIPIVLNVDWMFGVCEAKLQQQKRDFKVDHSTFPKIICVDLTGHRFRTSLYTVLYHTNTEVANYLHSLAFPHICTAHA